MYALQFTEYGGPEVISLGEAPEPHPGPGQIRIKVRAASLNGDRLEDPHRLPERRQTPGGRRATSAATRRAWSTRSARASPG